MSNPDKKDFLNEEKFEKLHQKFLDIIFEESIKEKYSEKESRFLDFSNKYLNENEIKYKNEIIENAHTILEIKTWDELIKTPGLIIAKLKQVCDQKISKPLLTPPKFGDKSRPDSVLYVIEEKQIKEFEKNIFELFLQNTNEEVFSKNYDKLYDFLVTNNLPKRSQFLAYLSFLADYEKYIPIRSQEFDDVLRYYGIFEKIPNFPWKKYNTYLTLIKLLKNSLSKKYPTPNTIQTHSYLWMVSSILKNKGDVKKDTLSGNIQNTSKEDFSEYFKILENKNQFIFNGPPGTGKTWKAGKIAKAFIEKSQVYQFSASEYEEYVIKSLASAAESHSHKMIPMGNNRFIIKNADAQIRGKFVFIQRI
jgi:hypothetical protein